MTKYELSADVGPYGGFISKLVDNLAVAIYAWGNRVPDRGPHATMHQHRAEYMRADAQALVDHLNSRPR